ncbi:MAG: DegT/DnrJ/EryC1/StrS family aminotransferase, partial [Candidatus Obscuribacterales bacterium]|nr:DegT/DnrJ/EryC1/StrS family aminotransferase [Candidatus Obscuribacterales bacterium]
LGAIGDAGMIVTSDEKTDTRLRSLRAHGSPRRYYHDELGINSRLDEIQAAALLTKLEYLKTWNKRREEIAALYNEALANCPGITTPTSPVTSGDDLTHVWHQYTIRVHNKDYSCALQNDTRQSLIAKLSERGIGSMCYYPLPLHMQTPFKCDYKYGDFPQSERAASEVLSLPMYPELKDDEVLLVAESLVASMNELTTTAPIQSPIVNPVTF